MKKIFTLMAVLTMSLAVSAQVAVWTTRTYSHWNEQTQKYEEKLDTFVEADYLFRYDQIDSFRIARDSYYLSRLDLYCYMKGMNGGPAMIQLSDKYHYDSESSGVYDYSMTLDSITWQPYPMKGIRSEDSIAFPLRTIQAYQIPNGEYAINMSGFFEANPRCAHVTDYSVTVADPSICDVQNVGYLYSFNEDGEFYSDYGLQFYLFPLAEGRTKLKVMMNGFERQIPLIIRPKEEIEDVDYGQDSLFNTIYGRMIETGNYKPYGNGDIPYVDEGSTSMTRGLSYLNDMSSDQVYWVWNDWGINDIRHNMWKADNDIINAIFQRLYYNIYLCNSFIHNAPEGDVVRVAEVRFIRAYLYYQLMDLFANVPIVTDNADFFTAPQATRAQVYDFVVSELLAAEQGMLEKKTDLYRVDKVAAWLLLSRVCLNSEVYAGKQDFSKAAEYAYKVMQSDYALCADYKYLFMGDNDTNGAQNEIVWALRQVGSEHSSYGGSRYLVASYADELTDVGITNLWRCANTRSRLPQLFLLTPNDARNLFQTSTNWYTNPNGKTILKWTGLYSNGQSGTDTEWPDTDIPMFRKAEAYLNYAEAVLRGGNEQGGVTAVQAVNVIRQRAGVSNLNQVTLNSILDERGREFYTESMRRPDLVRFNKYGGETGYSWQFKGDGSASGTNFPAYMNVFPIPQSMLQRNPALVQNAGY